MSLTSPTILDDLDIPKRTAQLAVMGKQGTLPSIPIWRRISRSGSADAMDRYWRGAWSRTCLREAARRVGAKVAVADLNLHSYEEFEAEAKDMTADSTVAEIEATGGTAFCGSRSMSVTTKPSRQWLYGSSRRGVGSMSWVANAGGGRGRPMDTKASTLDPALLQLVTSMNHFGTVDSCNAVAPIIKRQRSGKIITVSSVAGTAPPAGGGYAY